jgi:prepilin-type N-terminal cleavage/methylation domain-containing protein
LAAESFRVRRHGYTLFELLLVVAVMAVLGILAWSGVEGMYQRHQLRQAAEVVRIDVAQCRLGTIEHGRSYEFRFQPGGRIYQISPFDQVAATDPTFIPRAGELPESMHFESAAPGPDILPIRADVPSTSSPPANGTTTDWSEAVLFLPDGTATPAVFDVVDAEGQFVRLSVRALTGSVSSDTVQRKTSR